MSDNAMSSVEGAGGQKTQAKDPKELPVLSFHNATLFQSDIDTLKDKEWLGDAIITFFIELLDYEVLSRAPDAKIEIFRPSMSVVLHTMDPDNRADVESVRIALPQLQREDLTYIFLPVNISHNPGASGGGLHWSILLVCIENGYAMHYDTSGTFNSRHAKTLAKNLSAVMHAKAFTFLPMGDTPQQENGDDCGPLACMIMDHVLRKKLLMHHISEDVVMNVAGVHFDAKKWRAGMKTRIAEMKEELGSRVDSLE